MVTGRLLFSTIFIIAMESWMIESRPGAKDRQISDIAGSGVRHSDYF